jgi:hypothetical protein
MSKVLISWRFLSHGEHYTNTSKKNTANTCWLNYCMKYRPTKHAVLLKLMEDPTVKSVTVMMS